MKSMRATDTATVHPAKNESGGYMRRLMSLTVATYLLLSSSATSLAGETIRITNGDWPPFTSEQLPSGGPLSRIVSEAFALEGITVE